MGSPGASGTAIGGASGGGAEGADEEGEGASIGGAAGAGICEEMEPVRFELARRATAQREKFAGSDQRSVSNSKQHIEERTGFGPARLRSSGLSRGKSVSIFFASCTDDQASE